MSAPAELARPGATLRDIVFALAAHGEHPAVISVAAGVASPCSYHALAQRALRLAAGLAGNGVGRGVPVLLFGPNSLDWIVARLAIAAVGAVAVAIDDVATDAEIATLVPDSGARIGFIARAHLPRLQALGLGTGRRLFVLDDAPDAKPPSDATLMAGVAEDAAALPAPEPGDAAALVYTSGTTGTPKGFFLTHANILHNVRALAAQELVSPADRLLLPLPLHHVYPQTVGCFTVLALGATIVLPEAVAGPQIVAALNAAQASVVVGVPRLYAALIAGIEGRIAQKGALALRVFRTLHALSIVVRRHLGIRIGRVVFASIHRQFAPALELIASGGARFEADLIWRLEGMGWEVLSGWGLAETASIFTNNHRGKARIGSEGWVLAGGEIRVHAPDAAGVGELELRGPSVFAGYRNDAAATAAAFTQDGWFRTGDLGFVDRDGYVHIAGRVKEMIVLGGGKNIFPEELEKLYAESPYIKEFAVIERGGTLLGLVVPDLEAIQRTGSPRIEDTLRVALTERARALPSFQRISGFAVTRETLPRTRLGKYQRFALPAIYARAESGRPAPQTRPPDDADRALLAATPGREIWAWLAGRYPDKTLGLDLSPQLDLGIDSLEWVAITLEFGERFDVHFTEDDGAEIMTLRDLLRRAAERMGVARGVAPMRAVVLSPAQLAMIAPQNAALRIAALILFWLNRGLIRAVFGLDAAGLANVPAHGPFVIACNHLSDLDAFVIAAALPHRALARAWWSGDGGRVFGSAIGRRFARISRIFPVDERQPATTLAYARAVLERGEGLVWFPEAWRSPDGRLQRFMPGLGQILAGTPVPVVPARLSGTFEALPRDARWPRRVRLGLVLAAPFDPAPIAADATATERAGAITDAVRARIAALARPQDPAQPAK